MYHVLNRGNARRTIFEKDADYAAFARILAETQERIPMRILAWCLMPNHWHLVLWPQLDGALPQFMRLATLTHTHRWHAHRATAGTGHLYQGRYKAFAAQEDEHFLAVCRYVERNALAAGLVQRAEQWRWCSLWHSLFAPSVEPRVDSWPVARPSAWLEEVNRPATAAELEAVRRSAQRGTPYGEAAWIERTAERVLTPFQAAYFTIFAGSFFSRRRLISASMPPCFTTWSNSLR